jgi:hypothetical protein
MIADVDVGGGVVGFLVLAVLILLAIYLIRRL